MFNAESIKARIKAEPFIPLRLITSSGQAYDITHPDLVTDIQELLTPAKSSSSGTM